MRALTVREFCLSIGISVRTFWNLDAKGEMPPSFCIGRKRFIRPDTAEEWLRQLEQDAQRTRAA